MLQTLPGSAVFQIGRVKSGVFKFIPKQVYKNHLNFVLKQQNQSFLKEKPNNFESGQQ